MKRMFLYVPDMKGFNTWCLFMYGYAGVIVFFSAWKFLEDLLD